MFSNFGCIHTTLHKFNNASRSPLTPSSVDSLESLESDIYVFGKTGPYRKIEMMKATMKNIVKQCETHQINNIFSKENVDYKKYSQKTPELLDQIFKPMGNLGGAKNNRGIMASTRINAFYQVFTKMDFDRQRGIVVGLFSWFKNHTLVSNERKDRIIGALFALDLGFKSQLYKPLKVKMASNNFFEPCQPKYLEDTNLIKLVWFGEDDVNIDEHYRINKKLLNTLYYFREYWFPWRELYKRFKKLIIDSTQNQKSIFERFEMEQVSDSLLQYQLQIKDIDDPFNTP